MWITAGLVTVLANITTYLALSTLNLFQNNTTVNPLNVIADFVVASYTGYTVQTLTTVSAPFIDPVNGGVSIACPSHLFLCTATAGSNIIYGYWIEDAAGNLIVAGNIDPAPMNVNNNAIPLQIILNFQGLGTAVALVG